MCDQTRRLRVTRVTAKPVLALAKPEPGPTCHKTTRRRPPTTLDDAMSITNCAACAAPLAHDAPQCVRCKTRYCDSTCQHDHWRRGHKQICKKIHRGGNAEQYNADNKYKEAVAVAVEACDEDTKGQTCFICMEGIKRRTAEGLVSGFCACRGGSSFAHVSCLVRQAEVAVEEALENNLDANRGRPKWALWTDCSLGGQDYHGVVSCALGWACWKTYVGRPDIDTFRLCAMGVLASGLGDVGQHLEQLGIIEAHLATLRRNGWDDNDIAASNLARCYAQLERNDEALAIHRDVYARRVRQKNDACRVYTSALNLASLLASMGRFSKVREFMGDGMLPAARQTFGPESELFLKLWRCDAIAQKETDPVRSLALLEEIECIARRVFGPRHHITSLIQEDIALAK